MYGTCCAFAQGKDSNIPIFRLATFPSEDVTKWVVLHKKPRLSFAEKSGLNLVNLKLSEEHSEG